MTYAPPFRIMRETENELVVYKPPGLVCERRAGDRGDSLISLMERAGYSPVYLPHRLDGVTCGIVLTARSREAVAFHNRQIAEHRWHKYYIARTEWDRRHRPEDFLGVHKAYLKQKGGKAVAVRSGGAPSFLEIVALDEAPGRKGERHVLIRLMTGRFHQIRVMCRDLGLPLCGDPLYGGNRNAHPSFYLEHAALGYGEMSSGAWNPVLTPREELAEEVTPSLYRRLEEEMASNRL